MGVALLGLLVAALAGLGSSPAEADSESGATPQSVFVSARIASGESHTCAIVNDGQVRCWGFNGDGQLGLGNTTTWGDTAGETPAAAAAAVAMPAGARAVAITAGTGHTCVVLDTGGVRCWGDNAYGQLGLGSTADFGDSVGETPATGGEAKLPAGTKAVSITAGRRHTCAVLDNGGVRCWGANVEGQLGLGNNLSYGSLPNQTPANGGDVLLPTGTRAVMVTAGNYFTCALLNNGGVSCWGYNAFGQLGRGDKANYGDSAGETPNLAATVALPPGTKALAVSAGSAHVCAILDGNTGLSCWGDNASGQLGLGSNMPALGDNAGETPALGGAVQLPAATKATSIAAGGGHTCVVLDNQTQRCWGSNTFGQLGQGNTTGYGLNAGQTPASGGEVLLPPSRHAKAITTGDVHTCAVIDNGGLSCWGNNAGGQLGQGNTVAYGDNPGETPAVGGLVDLGPGNTIATTPPPVIQPPTDQPTQPTQPDQPVQPVVGAPGKIRALKIAGRPAAKIRTITWRAPATTGATSTSGPLKIASYRVTIAAKVHGKTRTLIAKTIKAPAKTTAAIKVKIKRTKLKHGRHTLTVRAINSAKKTGPPVTLRFKVIKR